MTEPNDDGVTVVITGCPVHTCALMVGGKQADCTSCLAAGCAMCPLVAVTGLQKDCTLPDDVCKGRPCPRF